MPGLALPRGGGFWEKGQQHSRSAMGAYGSQVPERKTELTPPAKTAGGGLMAGAGGAAAGYSLGSSIAGGAAGGSSGGPWGAAIGAGVGLLAYFLS